MSPRRAFPRAARQHEAAASETLSRFVSGSGWSPALPVPIEAIIESCYGLTILWAEIDEQPGEHILGALLPTQHQIVLNERHQELFERVIGPERFTLAHELGHWVYDADDPNQATLFDVDLLPVFCRGAADDKANIREVNANKFAACVLLPADLVRAAVSDRYRSWEAVKAQATEWGVSRRTLEIRLATLGLADLLPG